MILTRTVDADTDQKIVFLEESAPLIIQPGSVGLDRVKDLLIGFSIFLRVFNRTLEEIQSHQGWFTSLPGNVDFRYLMGLQ